MMPVPSPTQSVWEQRFQGGGKILQQQFNNANSVSPLNRSMSMQQQQKSQNMAEDGQQYLEVEQSQLSVSASHQRLPMMTPRNNDFDLVTARTNNEPVSNLFQNGQPVQPPQPHDNINQQQQQLQHQLQLLQQQQMNLYISGAGQQPQNAYQFQLLQQQLLQQQNYYQQQQLKLQQQQQQQQFQQQQQLYYHDQSQSLSQASYLISKDGHIQDAQQQQQLQQLQQQRLNYSYQQEPQQQQTQQQIQQQLQQPQNLNLSNMQNQQQMPSNQANQQPKPPQILLNNSQILDHKVNVQDPTAAGNRSLIQSQSVDNHQQQQQQLLLQQQLYQQKQQQQQQQQLYNQQQQDQLKNQKQLQLQPTNTSTSFPGHLYPNHHQFQQKQPDSNAGAKQGMAQRSQSAAIQNHAYATAEQTMMHQDYSVNQTQQQQQQQFYANQIPQKYHHHHHGHLQVTGGGNAQYRQTTVAVDLSPMTHSSQIFVPNYNQRQVGSSLDAKSVHKLNNWYENSLWNQRFAGGVQQAMVANNQASGSKQDPFNYFFFEASNNQMSIASNDDLMNNSLIIPHQYNVHQNVQASFEMGHSAISMSQMQGELPFQIDHRQLPQSLPQQRQFNQSDFVRSSCGQGSNQKKQRSGSQMTSSRLDSQSLLVKPNDIAQVQVLRNNFLDIARQEREDSKERDKNFMPEVRRHQLLIVPNGRERQNSLDMAKVFMDKKPPRVSNHSVSHNQPAVNLRNQITKDGLKGGRHNSVQFNQSNGNSQNMNNSSQYIAQNSNNIQFSQQRRVRSGQDQYSEQQFVDNEKNIFNSPQALSAGDDGSISDKSMVSNTSSIGGRSLLAQQMNNNGLNFENTSNRLQQRISNKLDRSQDLGKKKTQKQPSPLRVPPSPNQTLLNRNNKLAMYGGFDGELPLKLVKDQSSTTNIVKDNNINNNVPQTPQRSKPIGRPVGCKTMNDREFQKYQRSLFMQISKNDDDDDEDANDQLLGTKLNQNQRSRRASRRHKPETKGSGKKYNDGDGALETCKTGHAQNQHFLLVENNQSEFNGISNISNVKGDENQSEFMESGEADKLLGGEAESIPSNKNSNSREQISFGTVSGNDATPTKQHLKSESKLSQDFKKALLNSQLQTQQQFHQQ